MFAMTDDTRSIAALTRRYARFSLSAGGLASVIGGCLAVVAYFVGALQPPDTVTGRTALAVMPLIWIAAKELLRLHYYQRFGTVSQVRTLSERRWHLGFTLFTALVSIVVIGVILFVGGDPRSLVTPGRIGYLTYVALLPVLVWFFMRTPLEFIVGVFLVAQAALALVGQHYALGEQIQAPIAGLVLIVIGVRQHREFLAIERELIRLGAP
jgi:hypothetical protein